MNRYAKLIIKQLEKESKNRNPYVDCWLEVIDERSMPSWFDDELIVGISKEGVLFSVRNYLESEREKALPFDCFSEKFLKGIYELVKDGAFKYSDYYESSLYSAVYGFFYNVLQKLGRGVYLGSLFTDFEIDKIDMENKTCQLELERSYGWRDRSIILTVKFEYDDDEEYGFKLTRFMNDHIDMDMDEFHDHIMDPESQAKHDDVA